MHVIDSVFKGQGGGSVCVHYCTRKTHQWLLTIQHLSVSEIGVHFLCVLGFMAPNKPCLLVVI